MNPVAVFDDVTIEWSAYKHLEAELQLAINQDNCAKTLWQSLLLLRQCIMDKISTSADANLTTADLAKFSAANIAATPVQFSDELAMQLDYFGYLQLGYLGTCDRDSQQAMLDPFDESSIINLPSLHWRGSSSLLRQLDCNKLRGSLIMRRKSSATTALCCFKRSYSTTPISGPV